MDGILVFVPKKFEYLTTVKKVIYKEKKLKTAYLIDLMHVCMSRKFFNDTTEVCLNSTILRENYGTFYNYYINYLLENKFMNLKYKHKKGSHSRIYLMNPELFKNKDMLFRYENYDSILMKKKTYLKENFKNENKKSEMIPQEIKNHLLDSLLHINLDFTKAYKFLNEKVSSDTNAYMKNLFSIESINKGDIFYKEDKYGRFHTNFTVLKSSIRDTCIKIDNMDISGVDIKNSQPFLFALFLKENRINELYPTEYEKYRNNVVNGVFYDDFMKGMNCTRKASKKLVFRVLFGKNNTGKHNKLFNQLYPNIFKWLKEYKEGKDKGIIAHKLQKKESDIIFNKICREILDKKDIKLFTVHDAIYFPSEHFDFVNKIFNKHIDNIKYYEL